MKEKLFFLPQTSERIFVHIHQAEQFNGNVFLFFNPFFDEKNRSQRFQANTARALCEKGFNVVRFDYYGTGDSYGEIPEFSGTEVMADLQFLETFINENFSTPQVHLLGVRLGADIAVKYALGQPNIRSLHLIEPLFEGSKYLLEQRTRRKMFYRINKIEAPEEFLNMNGETFEDFQGYLISTEAVEFIKSLNSLEAGLSSKDIFMYKTDYLFSRKNYQSFVKNQSVSNRVTVLESSVQAFWERLELTDESELSNHILNVTRQVQHV